MDLLVLDTIHGGAELGDELRLRGHRVETVDVYRGTGPWPDPDAFDRVVAPVHLDPDHPLLAGAEDRLLSHHEAVGLCLADHSPRCLVEVTGARGKTTTAFALAAMLGGPGVLHTTAGTFVYPERRRLWQRSITPASVLPAARAAVAIGGWCVAEESLGVTGAGDLAVLTSMDDYACASGKRSALAAKLAACRRARRLLVPGGTSPLPDHPDVRAADHLARVTDSTCETSAGVTVTPLLAHAAYQNALQLSAAAAVLLGGDPRRTAAMEAIPGRLSVGTEAGRVLVDDANSGTTRDTAIEAARLARALDPGRELTLVIGEEFRAVCEGFSPENVATAIETINPATAVLVGSFDHRAAVIARLSTGAWRGRRSETLTLAEGRAATRVDGGGGPIVLAVKTWR